MTSFLEKIKGLIPAHDLLIDKADQAYAKLDQSTNVAESFPHLVVRVNSVSQLIFVVSLCLNEKIPVVMRGAGSGKSGGAVGGKESVVIDITRLNRIIEIDKNNMLAEVEPGVVLAHFQNEVMKQGLYYPPDPASAPICTLGGNVAENAAGPSTLKYGSTRDYLLGGQAIIGTGEIIDFGKRCPKGVSGFDIAALLCGSEGTLAVFTKLRLRLLPLPKSQALAMFFFKDEDEALSAVNAILNRGHLPKALEYIDDVCLKALNKFANFDLPKEARAALIIECDASYDAGAQEQLLAISSLLSLFSLIETIMATTEEERRLLWRRRGSLSEACSQYLGYKISEDIAVPLGEIAEFGRAIKKLSPDPSVVVAIFGHAGDGNLHVQIMFNDKSFAPLANELRHKVLLLVLSLKGTLTAEHGIGLQKKAYLPLEQSPALISLQKRIKSAFDPHYLLNPGKIFDE